MGYSTGQLPDRCEALAVRELLLERITFAVIFDDNGGSAMVFALLTDSGLEKVEYLYPRAYRYLEFADQEFLAVDEARK